MEVIYFFEFKKDRSLQDKTQSHRQSEGDLNFQFKTDELTSLPENEECLKLAVGKIHSTLTLPVRLSFCFARIGLF